MEQGGPFTHTAGARRRLPARFRSPQKRRHSPGAAVSVVSCGRGWLRAAGPGEEGPVAGGVVETAAAPVGLGTGAVGMGTAAIGMPTEAVGTEGSPPHPPAPCQELLSAPQAQLPPPTQSQKHELKGRQAESS